MNFPTQFSKNWIAPCGTNCFVCYVHLRLKKPCHGCRGEDLAKPNHCRNCKIYSCAESQKVFICGQCSKFPCVLIKRLDKSYIQRYHVSLIENGKEIAEQGVEQFITHELNNWTCSECGGVISLHDAQCSECGKKIDI